MPLTALRNKKFFTVDEANARVPMLQSILRDVTDLSQELKQSHERLIHLQTSGELDAQQERDLAALVAEMDAGQLRMDGYIRELAQLGAVLKDDFVGLVDFPAQYEGREVCLCYKYGEPAIGFWHETDAGFSGRRPIKPAFSRGNR